MKPTTLVYPSTKKVDITDSYFDVQIEDPYSWLEDDLHADTEAWIEEQNRLAHTYFSQIPLHDRIRGRLEEVWNFEKYGVPFRTGGYIYFFKNEGLQEQAILYRQRDGEAPELFLDPNSLSEDGTTSLGSMEFSADGSLVVCQISEGGSDFHKVIVIDTASKTIRKDSLDYIKFSYLSWKGNDGFFYSSYLAPEGVPAANHHLYYHKLGTLQQEDRLIFGGEQMPRRFILAYLTEDERYLVIGAAMSPTGNELYIKDMKEEDGEIKCLADTYESSNVVLGNSGSKLFIHTNLHAPNFRIVTVDAGAPALSEWKEAIPERSDVLKATMGGGMIFCQYLKDAISMVEQYNLDCELVHEVKLPSSGTVSGFEAKSGDQETYYLFSSYIYPPTIFKYNIVTGISEVYKKVNISFDPENYESMQIFYTSADGTRIPMMITCKKGTVLDGKNPTLLTGYGGFGISMLPEFSTSKIIFLEQGGVFAAPNLRGGGEYGRHWHEAGIQFNKQNVIDDFFAAADYLFEHNYTSKEYLAIAGASNGGLLAGAAITQRPDLFRVCFIEVGVLDMLRYNKFAAGGAWAYEYGQPEDSKEMFEYLLGYSPYHNVRPAAYPATLITTGDHDDRVVPAHSFKFAARLQENQTGAAPALLKVERNAGHGAGKSTAQAISEQADKWTFLFANMGMAF